MSHLGDWSAPLDVKEEEDRHETIFHSPVFKELAHQQQQSSSSTTTVASNISSKQSQFALQLNKKIVIDSGAIIHSAKLEKYGSEFYTTPLVLAEIKSSKSRTSLLLFPFEIKVRQPSEESYSIVSNYAQKTGDYGSLSRTDLSVLALTYQLEVEVNGMTNIKPEPPSLGITGFKKVQLTPFSELFKESDPEMYRNEDFDQENSLEEQDGDDNEQQQATTKTDDDNTCDHPHNESDENKEEEDDGWVVPTNTVKPRKGAQGERLQQNVEETVAEPESEDEDADSDGEWITKDNLHLHRKKGREESEQWDEPVEVVTEPEPAVTTTSSSEITQTTETTTTENTEQTAISDVDPEPHRKVGCMTVDFSMQNVLLHMGLNLVSFDGRRIKHLTRYVSRCYACSTIVPDPRRTFCPNCGNETLKKVSCIINDKGEAKFYYNPKRRINLRGSKYPIPLPKGGRNSKDPILREDQLSMFKYGKPHKAKLNLGKQRSLAGTEIWNPEYNFEDKFGGKLYAGKPNHVVTRSYNGYGRRNPNESINTGSRKKKKNKRN